MRRLAFVLSLVIGSLMLLVGGAAAVVFGPDDTVSASPIEVPAAARVAVTAPDLFPFANTTLHLTAANAGGAVFLGTGNPVDVGSYLSNVARYHINGVGVGGGRGSVKGGELEVPVVSPETTTFWADSVTGSGEQSLDVALTGDLFSIAVVPVGTPGNLSLSVGVTLAGAFFTAVGLAVVGVLFLVVPVVLRSVRARRSDQASGGGPNDPTTVLDDGSRVTAVEGVHVRTSMRAPRLAAVGLFGAITLTGCSSLPQPAALPTEPPTQVAIQLEDLPAALASYDERNNVARTLSASAFDPSGWAAADMGPALLEDQFSTAYVKAVGSARDSGTGHPRR